MPGQLVHTNEMMVLLGEDYFALRSAAQTYDVLARRLESTGAASSVVCH
jgi:unconventional prefoldin RPB5 interactor 1